MVSRTYLPHFRRGLSGAGLVGGLAALVLGLAPLMVQAQVVPETQSDAEVSPLEELAQDDPDARMLLEAEELVYDFEGGTVSARGDVQIYYRGYTIEADSIDYDQGTQRIFARGTVKVTEPDGNVLFADEVELTEDFREGFLQELTLVTPERARFVATSAERFDDNLTVFNRGVYTACEPCRENPDRAPIWQIKAQRIIHNQDEKIVYYENASFEFLGVPIAYVPFFHHPDPTVERQSGFLAPDVFSDSDLGIGARVPYFFALAPNYDLTVAATGFSEQGVMGDFEWRHRLASGTYSIEGAGIHQLDPEAFRVPGFRSPGDRDFRGYLRTEGLFEINEFWEWGFDGRVVSDETFLRKYDFTGQTEYRNQVFLTGQSESNWFDARVIDYESMLTTNALGQPLDEDGYLPVVHPVVDYNYIFGRPVLGGRLSFDANLLSLSRDDPEFVSNFAAPAPGAVCPTTKAGFAGLTPAQIDARCDLNGVPGTSNRFISQVTWEASFVDGIGQVFTPFASLRGDAYAVDIEDPYLAATGTPLTGDYLPLGNDTFANAQLGETSFFRGMPTIGLEYRYPILIASNVGYQIFEPIAQIIVRPDEQYAMEFPNEDAKSLVFDDTLLFQRDKFSGYDRVEGGTRANVGVRYSMQFHNGASVGAVFGQSFHLAGENPFPLGTGLGTDDSDYVAAAYVSPFDGLEFASRVRFDESDFELKRHDFQTRGTAGPLTGSLTYSDIDAEPLLGYNLDRREILGAATLRLDRNWRLFGSGRYEISGNPDGSDWIGHSIGFGYVDECIALAVAYERTYIRDFDIEPDERITFRLNLRTVVEGETSTSLRSDDET